MFLFSFLGDLAITNLGNTTQPVSNAIGPVDTRAALFDLSVSRKEKKNKKEKEEEEKEEEDGIQKI